MDAKALARQTAADLAALTSRVDELTRRVAELEARPSVIRTARTGPTEFKREGEGNAE